MSLYAAFLLGFLGSFHCVGMCGPLALAVPVQSDRWAGKLLGAVQYNLGRTAAYALLGILLGALGLGVAMAGYQQALSILMGTLLLFGLLLPKQWLGGQWFTAVFAPVKRQLGILLREPRPGKQWAIGFLNGLLPCGLVYMGIAGALSAGGIGQGGLFMVMFGLGTLPAMIGTMMVGNWIGIGARNRVRRWVPYIVGFMAILLILRGLNLGVPYVSPNLENMTNVSSSADGCH